MFLKPARAIWRVKWDNCRVRSDVRDVISISRLIRKSDGPMDIKDIILTLDRYSKNAGIALTDEADK
jgi:hypothetical protein